MRDDQTIIRVAIADPRFSLRGCLQDPKLTALHKYRIELPPAYRHGFPPVWDFAMVPEQTKRRSTAEVRSVLEIAQTLVDAVSQLAGTVPLVIVSADEDIELGSELPPTHPNVFYIEAKELLVQRDGRLDLVFSPFMRSIRKKFSEQEARAQMMTPYLPGKPVSGWRFFGREKELQRLASSPQNFVIVGARRTGKTSLLQELEKRLKKANANTYYVDVQSAEDEARLVDKLLEELDPGRRASLMRRKEIITESLLGPSLKAISARGNAVLLIDEIGNVITNMPKEAWRVLGVIRSYAQSGKLRVIATASQEFFLRQQEDFSGPWVNFATTIRLGGFRPDEVDDFVVKPFQLWGLLQKGSALIELANSAVGSNPYLLACFGDALFHDAITSSKSDALSTARDILQNKLIATFSEAVREVFRDIPSPTVQYLFLRKCHDAELRGNAIHTLSFDSDWIEDALMSAGYCSTVMLRRNLLEDMRVRALTEPTEGNPEVETIIAPVVYHVIRRSEKSIEKLIEKYRLEIAREASRRGLVPT